MLYAMIPTFHRSVLISNDDIRFYWALLSQDIQDSIIKGSHSVGHYEGISVAATWMEECKRTSKRLGTRVTYISPHN